MSWLMTNRFTATEQPWRVSATKGEVGSPLSAGTHIMHLLPATWRGFRWRIGLRQRFGLRLRIGAVGAIGLSGLCLLGGAYLVGDAFQTRLQREADERAGLMRVVETLSQDAFNTRRL